jgi:hypothetical protein
MKTTEGSFPLLNEAVKDPKLQWLDQLYQEVSARGGPEEAKFDYIKNLLNSPTAAQGSSRLVMNLDGQHVIKMAINAAGFAQNGMEATVGSDPAVEDVVAPVVGWSDVTDYDGFFWIVSKKAAPLSDSAVGGDWATFASYLKQAALTNDPITPTYADGTRSELPPAAAAKRKSEIMPRRAARKDPAEIYKLVPPQFFESFREFTNRYGGARTADLFKPDSWGIVDGELKLIDYGYTKSISSDYYAGGLFAGVKQAQASYLSRRAKSAKNVSDTLAGNIDTLEEMKNQPLPKFATLLLLLKGIVLGLPRQIEEFKLGDKLKELSPVDVAGAVIAVRNNERKVDAVIRRISDSALRAVAEDELEDLFLSQGKLGEHLLRGLIRELLDESLSKSTKATLRKKAEKRGLTPGSVEAEYKKGLAAWATSGSRPGMSQHQWAMARVNSATPSKSWATVKKSKSKKKKKK